MPSTFEVPVHIKMTYRDILLPAKTCFALLKEHSSNVINNPGHSVRKDICFNDEFWNSVEAEIGPERKTGEGIKGSVVCVWT